ncbi:gephyrin-like molybdotransferase Glp [Actinomyces gaoshouyii]|uniref:Molybdopterin molybdenumtransferase n=1 Tax=Actinomyces gaoshouyii TaxID=1960083 RepID=A0A8H9H7J8_9ACTO|nr:gephyrin-like molybdotransferase Glp [Actinomyces gaoshouyii]GGO96310.1 molybdopterin molybdenumtransferase MoeA [Actinomyces gaoshouyii]
MPSPAMITPERYVDEALAALRPLGAVPTRLEDAHGLVLAEDVTAALPVPPWTNSAMDGYALRAEDAVGAAERAPVILPVAGDIPAGSPPAPLPPGTAMRIMTGAMLPEGADAVVRVEDTDQSPGPRPLPREVAIHAAPAVGLHVRRAGEGCAAGDPVMGAGTLLGATAISALASVGRDEVLARPRPRVAIVSTGAELVEPGQGLAPGTIPDSNSLLLAGLIREHGAALAGARRSADSAEDLARALLEAAGGADLVVTSGGVSAGAFDPLTMLAAGTGARMRLSLSKVAMQPGKPQGHGAVLADDGREVPLLCLPGNPVSALVSFALIVAPALALLAGRPGAPATAAAPTSHARAAVAWTGPVGRRQYVPVRVVGAPDPLPESLPAPPDGTGPILPWVEPIHRLGSGSHLVSSLGTAVALAVVDEDSAGARGGDVVGLIPLPSSARPC